MSDPPLPLARVAAGVETGNDQESNGFGEKKERVGKFLCAGATDDLEDHGELPRVIGHALHDAVDFSAKAPA